MNKFIKSPVAQVATINNILVRIRVILIAVEILVTIMYQRKVASLMKYDFNVSSYIDLDVTES